MPSENCTTIHKKYIVGFPKVAERRVEILLIDKPTSKGIVFDPTILYETSTNLVKSTKKRSVFTNLP